MSFTRLPFTLTNGWQVFFYNKKKGRTIIPRTAWTQIFLCGTECIYIIQLWSHATLTKTEKTTPNHSPPKTQLHKPLHLSQCFTEGWGVGKEEGRERQERKQFHTTSEIWENWGKSGSSEQTACWEVLGGSAEPALPTFSLRGEQPPAPRRGEMGPGRSYRTAAGWPR